ncbi:MAG: hypothetical protein I3273_07275 [Candidatus Moeniiplasma glomeromycotorum]|nr:hypothetical protein [Candidatus Moeniiplasma glomeromycotorum]MCE8168315.1 hypothetical protein [Candidatus Moeniiplasma glomeromycotorum]MCE8169887.1 hypothetical protein [Candidatus Moeniiplasma glomeromycotorum]
MVKMKPELIIHRKENFLMGSGKVIVVEIKLQKLVGINKSEYPEDYKINWIAFNKVNPQELVRIDNHYKKSLHYHRNGEEKFIPWESLEKMWELFHQKIVERFGDFNKIL